MERCGGWDGEVSDCMPDISLTTLKQHFKDVAFRQRMLSLDILHINPFLPVFILLLEKNNSECKFLILWSTTFYLAFLVTTGIFACILFLVPSLFFIYWIWLFNMLFLYIYIILLDILFVSYGSYCYVILKVPPLQKNISGSFKCILNTKSVMAYLLFKYSFLVLLYKIHQCHVLITAMNIFGFLNQNVIFS